MNINTWDSQLSLSPSVGILIEKLAKKNLHGAKLSVMGT